MKRYKDKDFIVWVTSSKDKEYVIFKVLKEEVQLCRLKIKIGIVERWEYCVVRDFCAQAEELGMIVNRHRLVRKLRKIIHGCRHPLLKE